MGVIFYLIIIAVIRWLAIIYEWKIMEIGWRLVIAMMIISIISIMSALVGVKANLEVETDRGIKGNRIPISIVINNKSLMPVIMTKIKVEVTNEFYNISNTSIMNIIIRKWGTQKYTLNMVADCCGNYSVRIKKITMYDMLGLIKLSKKNSYENSIVVLPKYVNSDFEEPIENKYVYIDSDIFSKVKPGYDPSEVFDIRPMNDGDSVRKINWKMSIRRDEYMVNDYSLPIGKGTIIMLDTCVDTNDIKYIDKIDNIFQAVMEISMGLMEYEINHKIVFYNSKKNICEEYEIGPKEDIVQIFLNVYRCGSYNGKSKLARTYNIQYQPGQISHLYYIATKCDLEMINEIAYGKENALKKFYMMGYIEKEKKDSVENMCRAWDIDLIYENGGLNEVK